MDDRSVSSPSAISPSSGTRSPSWERSARHGRHHPLDRVSGSERASRRQHVDDAAAWRRSPAREAARPGVQGGDPVTRDRSVATAWESPPPKPVLYVNDSAEAERARRLLEAYDIDFETRTADAPAVMLEWNGETFTDIFGVADFLAVAGR